MDATTTKTIVAKIYDCPDDIALNDVYEVVGVLSLDFHPDEDLDQEADVPKSSPSRNSVYPHVHTISVFKLNHSNPLLPINFTPEVKAQQLKVRFFK